MNLFSEEELVPISFAKLLNEFVLSEELFPISFTKLLNEFVLSEELFPISFAKLLNECVLSQELFLPLSAFENVPAGRAMPGTNLNPPVNVPIDRQLDSDSDAGQTRP